jgi:hypothetical protein
VIPPGSVGQRDRARVETCEASTWRVIHGSAEKPSRSTGPEETANQNAAPPGLTFHDIDMWAVLGSAGGLSSTS